MNNRFFYRLTCVIAISVVITSCHKEFLEKKSDKSLLIPTTYDDLQSVLDNDVVMNTAPSLNLLSADEFYTTDEGFISLDVIYEQNSYIWSGGDVFQGIRQVDWEFPFRQVFYANIVLEGLNAITPLPSELAKHNQLKGSALFFRGFAFYNLAQEFSKPYNPASAAIDLGVPLRLHANVNERSVRASLQQTYDQIINDLTASVPLLQSNISSFKTRPSRLAALALLSRVYLSMGNYSKSKEYADAYLKDRAVLIDYNTLENTGYNPFPEALPSGNDEVVFYCSLESLMFDFSSLNFIDSSLYKTYDADDLRKTLLFTDNGNGIGFTGDYTGFLYRRFCGLATDEVLLNRAECLARDKNTDGAMTDLNALLVKRYKSGSFVPVKAADPDDALQRVLKERRKELVARGLRWTDLRRLNQDPKFAITLKRVVQGRTYTLPPNDKRYVFPIPANEIAATGIAQNPQ